MPKSCFCLKILEALTFGYDQPDLRMYLKLNKKQLENKTPSSTVHSFDLVFLSEK